MTTVPEQSCEESKGEDEYDKVKAKVMQCLKEQER